MLSAHEKTIQERVLGAWPELAPRTPQKPLPRTPKGLLLELRGLLRQAHQDEVFRTPEHEFNRWVNLDPKQSPGRPHVIVGGEKDFRREPASAHLVREDGSWLHFTIAVAWDGREALSLLAYDFEIVFSEEHSPRWLRVDLNEPGHPNEARELRSHLHPGNDDLLMPSPVMTPAEILHRFLYGLYPRDAEKPRR